MTATTKTLLGLIRQCPHLSAFSFSVDYLSDSPRSCAIENSGESVLKQYSDGSSLRRYTFLISLRLPYADDPDLNSSNAELIENIRRWFESEAPLPNLGDGRKPLSYHIISDGYVYYADSMTAKYQLKLAIDYHSSF